MWPSRIFSWNTASISAKYFGLISLGEVKRVVQPISA